MKRQLLLVALPALLGLVWWSGQSNAAAATADVRIDAAEVSDARTAVIGKLTAAGAAKTVERTAYGDGAAVHLQFRIPIVRMEEALSALRSVNGAVVEQRVDVDRAVAEADAVSNGLDGIDRCLASLADEVGRGNTSQRVAQCRQEVTGTLDRLRQSPAVAEDAVLSIDINRPSTSSPALVIAVAAMTAALAALILTTLRSRPNRTVVDVTDKTRDATLAELYHRRN